VRPHNRTEKIALKACNRGKEIHLVLRKPCRVAHIGQAEIRSRRGGGTNLYGMVGNDAVNWWDYLGQISDQMTRVPSIQFSCECTTEGECGCTEEVIGFPGAPLVWGKCFDVSVVGESRLRTDLSGQIENPHLNDPAPQMPNVLGLPLPALERPKMIDAFPEVLARAQDDAKEKAKAKCVGPKCSEFLETKSSCVCSKIVDDGRRALKYVSEEKNGVIGAWKLDFL
jgi:hypothetical protein